MSEIHISNFAEDELTWEFLRVMHAEQGLQAIITCEGSGAIRIWDTLPLAVPPELNIAIEYR